MVNASTEYVKGDPKNSSPTQQYVGLWKTSQPGGHDHYAHCRYRRHPLEGLQPVAHSVRSNRSGNGSTTCRTYSMTLRRFKEEYPETEKAITEIVTQLVGT